MKALCFFALLSAVWAAAQTANPNVLHVHIAGMRSDQGNVMCALYASPDGFPKDGKKARAQASSSISNRQAECDFPGIAPGTYAVAVFHDENSNGRLDSNFMGIPREGVGASNDAKTRFGPPKFEDAAFSYPGGAVDLKITMKYL